MKVPLYYIQENTVQNLKVWFIQMDAPGLKILTLCGPKFNEHVDWNAEMFIKKKGGKMY